MRHRWVQVGVFELTEAQVQALKVGESIQIEPGGMVESFGPVCASCEVPIDLAVSDECAADIGDEYP